MAPQKRKSNYVSDEFVVSDNEDASAAPPTKRSKASLAGAKMDDEGNQYWEISKARRATVSEFKGKKMISIREYYEKDGKQLPGKKGISMTLEQYNAFIEIMPHIEESLVRGGAAEVSRPDYNQPVGSKKDDSNEEDDDEGGKANHEATSDED